MRGGKCPTTFGHGASTVASGEWLILYADGPLMDTIDRPGDTARTRCARPGARPPGGRGIRLSDASAR